ncbi:MAG: hypothetical protein HIU86_04120 [Acidobacteria bacterium]|nr:hypothetical protein [Acidobacteriota bacterium]
MSEPQRRQVRVRRSPKIAVFLLVGAVVGALAAVVAVNVTPADATIPQPQAIGFLILLLAPAGAVVAGAIALLIDRGAERRSKVVEAERSTRAVPVVVDETAEVAEPGEAEVDPRR